MFTEMQLIHSTLRLSQLSFPTVSMQHIYILRWLYEYLRYVNVFEKQPYMGAKDGP